MRTPAKIALGLVIFAIFMLPFLVVIWLNMLQGTQFSGAIILVSIVGFVIGMIVNGFIIFEMD